MSPSPLRKRSSVIDEEPPTSIAEIVVEFAHKHNMSSDLLTFLENKAQAIDKHNKSLCNKLIHEAYKMEAQLGDIKAAKHENDFPLDLVDDEDEDSDKESKLLSFKELKKKKTGDLKKQQATFITEIIEDIINKSSEYVKDAINKSSEYAQPEKTHLSKTIEMLERWSILAINDRRKNNPSELLYLTEILHAIAKSSEEHAWYANKTIAASTTIANDSTTYAELAHQKTSHHAKPELKSSAKAANIQELATHEYMQKFWSSAIQDGTKKQHYQNPKKINKKKLASKVSIKRRAKNPTTKTPELLARKQFSLPKFPEIDWNIYLSEKKIATLTNPNAELHDLLPVKNRIVRLYKDAFGKNNIRLQQKLLRTLAYLDNRILSIQIHEKQCAYLAAIGTESSIPDTDDDELSSLRSQRVEFRLYEPAQSEPSESHFSNDTSLGDDDELDELVPFLFSDETNDDEINKDENDNEAQPTDDESMSSVPLATSNSESSSLSELSGKTPETLTTKINFKQHAQLLNRFSLAGQVGRELIAKQVELESFNKLTSALEENHIPAERQFWRDTVKESSINKVSSIINRSAIKASQKLEQPKAEKITYKPQKKAEAALKQLPICLLPNDKKLATILRLEQDRIIVQSENTTIAQLIMIRDGLETDHQSRPKDEFANLRLQTIANLDFRIHQDALRQAAKRYTETTSNIKGKIKALLPKTVAHSQRNDLALAEKQFQDFMRIETWLLKTQLTENPKSTFLQFMDVIKPLSRNKRPIKQEQRKQNAKHVSKPNRFFTRKDPQQSAAATPAQQSQVTATPPTPA